MYFNKTKAKNDSISSKIITLSKMKLCISAQQFSRGVRPWLMAYQSKKKSTRGCAIVLIGACSPCGYEVLPWSSAGSNGSSLNEPRFLSLKHSRLHQRQFAFSNPRFVLLGTLGAQVRPYPWKRYSTVFFSAACLPAGFCSVSVE